MSVSPHLDRLDRAIPIFRDEIKRLNLEIEAAKVAYRTRRKDAGLKVKSNSSSIRDKIKRRDALKECRQKMIEEADNIRRHL